MKKNYLKGLILLVTMLMPCYLTAQFRLIEVGFEEGMPAGWTQEQVYGNADWTVQTGSGLQYPTGAHSGQSRAYFYQPGSTPARTKLISPLVTDGDANLDEPVLIFHYAMEKFSETPTLDTLRVYYRTSTASPWTLLREYVQLQANWILESIPVGVAADAYQFAFEASNGNGRGIVLDDIYFGNTLICDSPPASLQTFNIRSDEATVSWSGNVYASYHLYVSTTQGAPPDNPVGLDIDTLFNSYKSLTGLQPSTTYYFYVRSDCGYGDVSAWAAGSFKTGCPPVTELNETFNSWTTGTSGIFTRVNGCWTTYAYDQTGALSTTASHWPVAQANSTTYSPDGTKTLKLSPTYQSLSAGETYNIAYIVSPELAASVDLSQLQLAFTMHAGSKSVLRIGIADYPMDLSNYTEIQTVRCDNPSTIEYKTVPLNTYTGSGRYIVIYASGLDVLTTVNADREIYLDNVSLQPLGDCANLRLSTAKATVTVNSANLEWNSHAAAKWNLKVSAKSINPNFDAADVFEGESASNSKLVDNLAPGTTYFYYIQPVCEENTPGIWSTELKFLTKCDPAGISTFPYKESFDTWQPFVTSGAVTTFIPCWERRNTYSSSTAYPYVASSSNNYYSAPGALLFSYNGTTYSLAVSPKINEDITKLQVRFKGRGSANAQLVVGIADSTNVMIEADVAYITAIDTAIIEASGNWYDYVVKFDQYTGTGRYIVFLTQLPPNGKSSVTSFYMDDLVIEKIPTCFNPADFKQTARTDNSISLSWLPGGSETNWEIAYGKSGFDPNIAATRTIVPATQSSATITDLPFNATLDFYVRAACGGADGNSNWTGPVTFTTPQIPITLPYATKFESAEDNSQWTFLNGVTYPNKWYIGSAAYASGNNGMYVSTSGVQNDYANTISYIYAYRILDFPEAGLYDVAFRWRAKGDGNNDFMKAFLVPDEKTITNANANGISATATPADWIALGGVLNTQENWTDTVFKPIILESGKYKLVFYWANNNSVANYPAAAIDSVSVKKNTDCMTVRDNSIKKINDTDAMLHFIGFNTETWDLKVSTTAIAEANLASTTAFPFDGTIDTTAHLITGLQPETTYYYYLKSSCDNTWVSGSFTTRCARVALPVEDNFSTHGTPVASASASAPFPSCWTRITTVANYPFINTTNYPFNIDGNGSLFMLNTTSGSTYSYAITPMLDVAKLNKVQVTFMGYGTAGRELIVGAIEDPDNIETFVPVDTVSLAVANTWEYFEVPFDEYSGNAKYIALFAKSPCVFRVDDLVIEMLPPCRTPVNLETDNVTSSSAKFIWKGYNAEAFNIKISTTPIDPETQAADFYDGQIDTLGLSLNTLRYNTQYYWYIQNICGEDGTSLWSKEATFRTECAEQTSLPLKENFDGYAGTTFPYCWTKVRAYSTYPQFNTTYKVSGTSSLYFSGGGANYQLAATPKLAVDDISKLQVKFKARIGSSSSDNNSGIAVGVITDINNPATFVALDTIKRTQSNSVFYDYTVDLSGYTGSGKYIAFSSNVGSSTSNTTYIDDVVIEHNPAYITCVHPVAVSESNITHNSARIAWNENGGIPEHYNIKIASYPIDPALEDADVAFIDEIDNDHYVANGIFSPSSTYYVYVQAVCSETDSSYWSDAGVFTTTCPPVSTFPLVEIFESYGTGTNVYPPCWRVQQQVTGAPSSTWLTLPYVAKSDTTANGAYLYFSVGGNATFSDYSVVDAIMPQLEVEDIQDYQLSFRFKSPSTVNAKLLVGVMSDWSDPSTFVGVDTFATAGYIQWQNHVVNFSGYVGTGRYISFRVDGRASQSNHYTMLDDIDVRLIPDCAAPYRLRAGNVERTSANFEWQAGNTSDTQWDYVLTNKEVDLSIATASDSLETYKVRSGSVSTVSCTVDGLTPGTTYYFYVKNACGEYYPTGLRVMTKCSGSIPLFEDFEKSTGSGVNNPFPDCWSRMNNYNISPYPFNQLISGTQDRALYMYSGSVTDYSLAVTPELDTDNVQSLRARFRAYKTATSAAVNVLIGIMTNPTDTATFVPVDTIRLSAAATWYNIRVPFSAYEGTGKYVAFLSRVIPGVTTNGVYIDNLYIEEDIDCEVPVNVKLAHRTDSTFTVNWNKVEGQTAWEVAYGLSGFNLSSSEGYTTEVVTDSFFVGENLSNTHYDVYIRALCGENDASPWADKITFLSLQEAVNVPYFNGFEEAEENSQWTFIEGKATSGSDKNYWMVGDATAAEGTHSLYITKDGMTNSSNTASTYSYAYRTVDLPKGNYDFSFKWKGMGYRSNYYLKVLLIPDTITLVPNVSNNIYTSGSLQPKSYIDISADLTDSINWSRHSKTLTITESLAGRYNLVFYWRNGSSTTQPPAAVDSISIELAPCTTPINLKATEITGTSAKLGWTNHNSFDWHIKVFSQPMGIDTVGLYTGDVLDSIADTNPFFLENLTEATRYYWFVKADCDSVWVGANFMTVCPVPKTLPLYESFDFNAAGVNSNEFYQYYADCWTRINTFPEPEPTQYGITRYQYAPYYASTKYNGVASLWFLANASGNSMGVMPAIDIQDISKVHMTFKGRKGNADRADNLIIGVMDNPDDFSSFTQVTTVTSPEANTNWHPLEVSLSAYTGSGKYIAFYCASEGGITNQFYMDDLRVGCWEEHDYYDSTCKGYDYERYGFTIDRSELYETGLRKFTRTALTTTTGCDSIVNLYLTVGENTRDTIYAAVCEGGVYTYEGIEYRETGKYTLSYNSAAGCDSVVVLDFKVNPNYFFESTTIICAGSIYEWRGQEISETGVYYDSLKTVTTACDSIYKLNVNVVFEERVTLNEEICEGNVYAFKGTYISEPGTYIDTLRNMNNCDSIVTLNLKVNRVYNITQPVTLCAGTTSYEGYGFSLLDPNGIRPESHIHRGTTVSGCDSTFTLVISISEALSILIEDAICQGETYDPGPGFIKIQDTDERFIFIKEGTSILGCDSTTSIIVTKMPAYELFEDLEILTSNLPYAFGDTIFDVGTVSGNYIINSKTDFGCDSIVNLTLTITTSGLSNNVYGEYFNIAPNPVKLGSPTYVNYNFNDLDKDGLYIEVFNSVGTLVYSYHPDTYPVNIGEFVGSTGLYVVRIITGTNKVLLAKLIVQ